MAEDPSELGPGLHVYTAIAALEHAGRLATELRADLCTTTARADALLVERQAMPVLSAADLDELRAIAARVVTADRIVGETRMRAAADVAERLAETGAGMAIHPLTIRERAEALLQAQRQLEQADQLLAAQETMAAEEVALREAAPTAVSSAPPAPVLTRAGPHPQAGLPGALAPRAGGGGRGHVRVLEHPPADVGRHRRRLRGPAAAELRDDQRALLAARRTSAEEQVRVAARAWHELAGADTGPEDVEAVVRRFDPQHQEALVVAEDTVHVRAVTRLQRSAIERWVAGWERLGLDAPPPSMAGTVVEDLARIVIRPIVLAGDAIDQARTLSEALPNTPVVVVEAAAAPVLPSPDATMPEPEGSDIDGQLEAAVLDDDVS